MSLIKCPECGREVSDQAAACPQCGYPLAHLPIHEKDEQKSSNETIEKNVESPVISTESQSPPNKKIGCGVVVGIFFAVIILIIIIASISGSRGNSSTKTDIEAYTYAQLYIQENYYSDAEFNIRDATITETDNGYTVSGKFSHAGVVYHYRVSLILYSDHANITSCNVY